MIGFIQSLSNVADSFVLTNESYFLDGETLGLGNYVVPRGYWTPRSIYKNGRTYIVARESVLNGCRPIVVQYYNGQVSYKIIDYSPGADYHNSPSVAVDDNGYIWVVTYNHRQTQNGTALMKVFKSDLPYDINNFTEFQTITDLIGYPSIISSGNDMVIVYRRNTLGEGSGIVVRKSENGGQFGSALAISTVDMNPDLGENQRHYHSVPFANKDKNGWFHYMITKRINHGGPSDYQFTDYWHVKTQDHETFYNQQETVSKNISEGAITESEFNDDYCYLNIPHVFGLISQLGTGTISRDGIPHFLVHNHQSTKDYWITIIDGSWDAKEVVFPFQTIWPIANSKVIHRAIVENRDRGFSISMHDYINSTLYKTVRYVTKDRGSSFENKGYMFPDVETSDAFHHYPTNYNDIPKGGKLAVISQSYKGENISHFINEPINDLYIKILKK